MGNPDDYDDLTPGTVKRAQEGDREAAFRVLDAFRAAVDAGESPHPAVLAYVAAAFTKISDAGMQPARALGIERSRGEHGIIKGRGEWESLEERDFCIAAYVEGRLEAGDNKTRAIGDAVNKFDLLRLA